MAYVIVAILLLGFFVIATGNITKVNKAAVAVFAGTVGWVLYICYGADFVMSEHPREYADFLHSAESTSVAVKEFVAQNIFFKYVGEGAEIVLFLLATMTIVEILNNNGCFDFLTEWLRTRNSKKMLWMLTAVTFLISANLDNLTTTTMMLTVMYALLSNKKQRIIYGCAIVVAANCGGALTVIGDPVGLMLWNNGAVTASNFSASLAIPCLIAWVLPTYYLSRSLPERVDTEYGVLPYRGDDTNLNRWQRIMMLLLAIGGLWFIPTFHNITKLTPFLGALCVLSVLWVVNEIVNRRLMNAGQVVRRSTPRALQYGMLQMILFVMGIVLAVGVVKETGVMYVVANWFDHNIHNVWVWGVVSCLVSLTLDTFATFTSFVSMYEVADAAKLMSYADSDYVSAFVQNGIYWKIMAFSSAMGGNVLLLGSVGGLALMKMEKIPLWWYFKKVGLMAFVGWAVGLLVLFLVG